MSLSDLFTKNGYKKFFDHIDLTKEGIMENLEGRWKNGKC